MIWLFVGTLLPSLLIAWGTCFLVRRNAPRWSLVDQPGGRKTHATAVPTGGGIAIWAGVIVPFALGYLLLGLIRQEWISPALVEQTLPSSIRVHLPGMASQAASLWTLLAGGTIMMILGLIDDRRGLGWRLRLGVQLLVATWMVWQGFRLSVFLDLPWLTGALSVLWIVALVNSFNMLDNMDGLAAGVAGIAAAILVAVMLGPDPVTNQPQLFVAGMLLVLIGSLAGFLRHNSPPAKIFMGDAGSYFVGFIIATTTLSGTFSGGDLPRHTILAPLCALAIPLYDMTSVILIRLKQRRSPFEADRNHFSHRLVDLGLSKEHAVWTIYLATGTCGLGALLLRQVDASGAAMIVLIVAAILSIIAILEFAGGRK